MAGFTASPSSPTKSSQQSQGTTGSRLAYLYYYCNPKMLFRREFYATGLRGGALTFVAVLSVLALYSLVAAVSVVNVIKYIKGRKTTKSASLPRPPPGDYELADKAAGKPIVDELDMDNVQEIPGEMDFAALKDVMPAPDQIPEIDSDEDESSVDERGPAHHVMSDDDTTLVGQEDFAGVKGSPETQIHSIIPVLPLENKFERPISPPATPPTNPQVAAITPDKFGLEEEPSKADAAIDKVTEMTVNIVEEAAKAVEEHKQIVEEVNKPAPATTEAGVDEPKLSEAPSDSEYVVVSDAHPESPITKEEPTKLPEVAFVATVDSLPKALSAKLFDEPMSEPLVSEPASTRTAESTVKEAKPEVAVAALVAEPEVVEAAVKPVKVEEPKPVDVSHPIEAATMVEAPKEVEAPRAVDEPQQVEAPKVVEAPKLVETPAPAPKETPAPAPAISKSLGRPRVMRRATGSTAATASASTVAITSPLSSTVSTSTLDKSVTGDKGFRRADDALNKLAGSILRSSPSERAPSRPASPSPSAIPRSGSPAPGAGGRSASPAYLRSDSPTSDAGTGGSRPASPALGMSRRGSTALANGAKPSVSRQSSLANVTNAPVRQPSALTNSSIPARPPSRQGTFSNIPRGGASSPPPMPLPPARQGSLGRSASPPPQIPQAAVMSPSVLSRKATLDSNGSPGSPPAPAYRQSTPPPRSRTPAEEFSTTGATARRRVPFPSAQEAGHTPVPAANAVNNASPARPKPRPRTSTSNGSSNAPSAPNTLQASLLSNLTGSPKPPSPSASSNASNPASPARRDSFVSAVSKRDSIFSVYEYSDMDMSVSDLDFPGSEGHRVGRLNSMSSIGSTDGEGDEGLSGNEEEKRKKRARRRSKAKAQQMKKQKRSKRN